MLFTKYDRFTLNGKIVSICTTRQSIGNQFQSLKFLETHNRLIKTTLNKIFKKDNSYVNNMRMNYKIKIIFNTQISFPSNWLILHITNHYQLQ